MKGIENQTFFDSIFDFFNRNYNVILGVVASLLVFRIPATILIILFIVLSVCCTRSWSFSKERLTLIFIIAIPFILNILFFWNNYDFHEGIKQTEKYLTNLILPIIIIGRKENINFLQVLKVYAGIFGLILILSFGLHILVETKSYEHYLEGFLVWQMGYKYALFMGSHAPALNMHISFLVVSCLYIIVKKLICKAHNGLSFYFLILFSSIVMLLIVNSRVAVLNAFIGILLILSVETYRRIGVRKSLRYIAVSLFGLLIVGFLFIKVFPYSIEKYTEITFKHLNKVGKLDDLENPEKEVYNSLVTRLSIWKTTLGLSKNQFIYGYGASDAKNVLVNEYIKTDQQFLARHKFPVHNQYLDFLLRFGFLGIIGFLIYIFFIYFLWVKTNNVLILFFFILFSISNLTDDFMIRFDGIVYSAFWLSLFSNYFIGIKANDSENSSPIKF